MSSPCIVEALDVLEQGKSGIGLCGKTPAINQFAFQTGEEALAQGVVVTVADRTHGRSDTGLSASLAEDPLKVYCDPWSLWWITSSGLRWQRAISRASETSSLLRWLAMDHRATRRLKASITTER